MLKTYVNLLHLPGPEKVCVQTMDVLLNGLSISAKGELQLLCCIMGKRCHFDITFCLLIVGDWQASFSANEQPYFADVFDTIVVRIRF